MENLFDEKLFSGISCEITEIPCIEYTYVPTEPNISAFKAKFSAIIEEIEDDKEIDIER